MMRKGGAYAFAPHHFFNQDRRFGGCGMRSSWDPIDLLPDDPFDMNLGTASCSSEADAGEQMEDFLMNIDDIIEDFRYICDTPFLLSLDAQMNAGYYGFNYSGPLFVGYRHVNEAFNRFPGAVFDVPGLEEEAALLECSPSEEVEVNCLHEGLLLSLGYMGLRDLLCVEMVCRSLCAAVRSDPLLWRCIHVDAYLGERMTDEDLYGLALKAQGSLLCLSLVNCSKITDDGLKRVMECNLMLSKLSVPGCIRLTTDGLISSLGIPKKMGMPGVRKLVLGRHFVASGEDYEALRWQLAGCGNEGIRELQFFHEKDADVEREGGPAIDVEICPSCDRCRVVFDCPSESCREKGAEKCRACGCCIERCILCGRCVKNCQYTETFFMNNVCSGCCANASTG